MKAKIKEIKGNSFMLFLKVKRCVNTNGMRTESMFPLEELSNIEINLISKIGKVVPLPFETRGDGLIDVLVSELNCGTYSLEIKGTYYNKSVRAFKDNILGIAESLDCCCDEDGYQVPITLHVQGVANPTIISEEYSLPLVEISYPKIPSEGGSVYPNLTYSQTKTTIWSDYRKVEEEITTGAEVVFTGASSDGKVTASATIEKEERVIATVTVDVTLNGLTSTRIVDVYQEKVERLGRFYIGGISSKATDFRNLGVEDLLAESTMYTISKAKTDSYEATKTCVFLLIPLNTLDITRFDYVSGGLKTDILADDMWNLTHDHVYINGETYKVVGYRSGGITPDDPLTFNYQVSFIS